MTESTRQDLHVHSKDGNVSVISMAKQKEYILPEYIRRAHRNYHLRRMQNDPEYREKERLRHKERRMNAKNDEDMRKRMQEKRRESWLKQKMAKFSIVLEQVISNEFIRGLIHGILQTGPENKSSVDIEHICKQVQKLALSRYQDRSLLETLVLENKRQATTAIKCIIYITLKTCHQELIGHLTLESICNHLAITRNTLNLTCKYVHEFTVLSSLS